MFIEIEYGKNNPVPDHEGKINNEGFWIPVEREHYWDFVKGVPKDEDFFRRFIEFAEFLHQVSVATSPIFHEIIGDFFQIDHKWLENTRPRVCLSPSIAGISAGYHVQNNDIDLPVSYAFPYFLGQTVDIRGTKFIPTLGHEDGHRIHLAFLAKGNRNAFTQAWNGSGVSAWEKEFVARLCQRAISEEYGIYLRPAVRQDFSEKNEHQAYIDSDNFFPTFQNLPTTGKHEILSHPLSFTNHL